MMQRYSEYKDSGVDWLGEIPAHWEVKRAKFLLNEINKRSITGEEELLSLSKDLGVIPKRTLAERAGQANTLVGYKIVECGDLVINKMQAANGLISVSSIEGVTSPDYGIYRAKSDVVDILYIGLALKLPIYLAEIKRRVTGVMEGFIRLYTDDLFEIPFVYPPLPEQTAIAHFLDEKTAKIDAAIDIKKNQIEKLNEYKTTLINAAVTGKIKVV
jgi:type I restriction enzyme S subunit